MARLQLALNVPDLDDAVAFYTTLFGVGPDKVRPGYANFAVEDPPLKLVLIEGADGAGRLNHLGIEVASSQEVAAATAYLAGEGMATDVEEATTCCYAVQDKVWVDGPDGSRWEVYTVLADADIPGSDNADADADAGPCCATSPVALGAPAGTGSPTGSR